MSTPTPQAAPHPPRAQSPGGGLLRRLWDRTEPLSAALVAGLCLLTIWPARQLFEDAGWWGEGRLASWSDAIGTVCALAAELGLAVNTVARAYRELEATGVIETRGRQGSFIKAGRHDALDAGFVRPAPGGDVLRNPAVLPTGRNIHGFDPCRLPSAFAVADGARQVARILARHAEEGKPLPESVAIVLWGTDNLKSEGGPIAQALALLGAAPRAELARLSGDRRLVRRFGTDAPLVTPTVVTPDSHASSISPAWSTGASPSPRPAAPPRPGARSSRSSSTPRR